MFHVLIPTSAVSIKSRLRSNREQRRKLSEKSHVSPKRRCQGANTVVESYSSGIINLPVSTDTGDPNALTYVKAFFSGLCRFCPPARSDAIGDEKGEHGIGRRRRRKKKAKMAVQQALVVLTDTGSSSGPTITSS
ncbi:hypothetical protein GW17_00026849 [Ensete ventricosum]|nr:hypothetical protein GW17_00026849 [Ensete ventricosum]